MQQELAAGRFPLWASGPFGGLTIFANNGPGVLYPLHLLWVLFPVGAGLGLILALKIWLAGLGMWGFLRALGLPDELANGSFRIAVGRFTSEAEIDFAIERLVGAVRRLRGLGARA